jgi:putative transposase
MCDAEDLQILKGVVSKDHAYTRIEYPSKIALSDLARRLKCHFLRILKQEFPQLHNRYLDRHFWAIGYKAWSAGNITDEIVHGYLCIIEINQTRMMEQNI